MYPKISISIGIMITLLSSSSIKAESTDFKTPSGNIFCTLQPGSTQETNSLRCEILGLLKPKPPEPYPGYCPLDWGHGFLLSASDRPEILCIGDTIANPNNFTLDYGKTWNNGGFKCVSQKAGLTCKNNNGYGFFLSKNKWRVLGVKKH